MAAEKTFQQILEDKMADPALPKPESTGVNTQIVFEPFLADFQVTTFRPSKSYPRPSTPIAKPISRAKPQPVDRLIPTDKLSEAERLAVRTLEITMEGMLSKNQVKASHRALVRKYHPDRHAPTLAALEKRLLTEKFHLIQEAYDLLEKAFQRL